MASKVTLQNLLSGFSNLKLLDAFNNNNSNIMAMLDNTLSRNGRLPNHMEANIDMNSYRLLNLKDPQDEGDAVNLRTMRLASGPGDPLLRIDLASSVLGKGVDLVANAVRTSNAANPVNSQKVWFSDTGWRPDQDPVYGRSTPQTALVALGGHYDLPGGPSVGYQWGIQTYFTNPGTMPLTNIDAVAQGWKVRAGGFTARQVGTGGDGHAVEILSGQYASRANVTTTNGSPNLTVNDVTFDGSKFSIGDAVSGTNIPGGATIIQVTKNGVTLTGQHLVAADDATGGTGYQVGDLLTVVGGTRTIPVVLRVVAVDSGVVKQVIAQDQGNYSVLPSNPVSVTGGLGTGATFNLTFAAAGYGYPDSIRISANATGSGPSDIKALSGTTQTIGLLLTGSGDGGADGNGNQDGRAIQIAGYGNASYFYGINIGASGIRSDGAAFRLSSLNAQRGLTIESCTLNQAVYISGGSYANMASFTSFTASGSMINISAVTATNGINFASNNVFSGAALSLQGQNIATDNTIGMQIATSTTQKIAFHGSTPVAKQTVTGSRGGNAALASLLTALDAKGLITNSSSA